LPTSSFVAAFSVVQLQKGGQRNGGDRRQEMGDGGDRRMEMGDGDRR